MARKRIKPVEPKKPDPPKFGEKKHEPAPPRLEGTEMPDDLRARQQEAAREPPPPARLQPAKDDLGAPADAPPVPPRAAADPVPRVIDQSERSPDPQRLARFKIRAGAPFAEQPYRYVLAAKGDKQAAIDHYLETTGLRAVLDTYPEGQAPRPLMLIRELPD